MNNFKKIITLSVLVSTVAACSSTTYKVPYMRTQSAGTVNLVSDSANENPMAKQQLLKAVSFFDNKNYLFSENSFHDLNYDFQSSNNELKIRTLTAVAIAQLNQGEIDSFLNNVDDLVQATTNSTRLPKKTQLIIAIASTMKSKNEVDTRLVDQRILTWVDGLVNN
ncbi:MAG: hypothetical protein OCD00_03825 [Colwellia sp.]